MKKPITNSFLHGAPESRGSLGQQGPLPEQGQQMLNRREALQVSKF